MEETKWKKDETPYIVFACNKCKQFMYVKHKQKSKKCLRCGRFHKVSAISDNGEIVYGMTKAVERVKQKQHELALKELGSAPQFIVHEDFRLQIPSHQKNTIIHNPNIESEYLYQFKQMILELNDIYKKVPYYGFEILADNYSIPEEELKILIRLFQREGILIKNGLDYIIKLD